MFLASLQVITAAFGSKHPGFKNHSALLYSSVVQFSINFINDKNSPLHTTQYIEKSILQASDSRSRSRKTAARDLEKLKVNSLYHSNQWK